MRCKEGHFFSSGAYLSYVTVIKKRPDIAGRGIRGFLIIAAADKVIDRNAKKYAQLNQCVVVRLVPADFPA